MPHETAAVSTQVLCTPYNHAPCHFLQNHIRKVYACFPVTCHMHFWQNDRDLLRATAITRGWNGYRNKSQHRKSTLEKKISRRSCRDSNPRPFNHESGALTTELSPPRRSKHIAIPWRSLKHVYTILFFQACLDVVFFLACLYPGVVSSMSVSWCCVKHVCILVLCQACLYPGVVSGMFVPGCCVRHVCTRVLCQACLYLGVVSGMDVPGCSVTHGRTLVGFVFFQTCPYPGILSDMSITRYFVKYFYNLVFCQVCLYPSSILSGMSISP